MQVLYVVVVVLLFLLLLGREGKMNVSKVFLGLDWRRWF